MGKCRTRRSLLIAVGFLWLFVIDSRGQGFVENAQTFSQSPPSGSARILSMGGASTALGGDYTSSYSNPAGIGMFNRSEFSFSPALNSYSTEADYFGNKDADSRTVFNFPGLGLVMHQDYEKDNGFVGGSLAITMTRTNDFNSTAFYHGTNPNTSIIDYFIDNANGRTTDAFIEDPAGNFGSDYYTPAGLGYQTYLFGPISDFDSSYPNGDKTYFTFEHGIPDQSEEIVTKGATNQWNFAYGANYKDKLFIGAAIGLSSLHYKNRKDYQEFFSDDTLQNLDLKEKFDIRGSGVNATFGIIGRPVDFFQIGISLTTPTFFTVTDTYSASLEANWNNFDYFGDGSTILNNVYWDFNSSDNSQGPVISDYNLTIPLKFRTGIALISSKGFITAEVETMNPAHTKYSSDTPGVSFRPENEGIQASFKPVTNVRVGAEYRYDIFRVRAGFARMGNALESVYNQDLSVNNYTGGLGIRTKSFFIDLAVLYSKGSANYSPYVFNDGSGPVVKFDNTSTRFMTTVGFSL